jgi:SET domain-containing protein
MPAPAKLFRVQRSAIHQRGVFATQAIAQGTPIVEYKGEKISKTLAYKRATGQDPQRPKAKGVYIFELNQRYDLDGDIPGNPAKYINHSCEPNCEAVYKRGHIYITALRDIAPGEELSFDYGYPLRDCLDRPCHCGAPSCVGYMVAKAHRRRLQALLKGKAGSSANSSLNGSENGSENGSGKPDPTGQPCQG